MISKKEWDYLHDFVKEIADILGEAPLNFTLQIGVWGHPAALYPYYRFYMEDQLLFEGEKLQDIKRQAKNLVVDDKM